VCGSRSAACRIGLGEMAGDRRDDGAGIAPKTTTQGPLPEICQTDLSACVGEHHRILGVSGRGDRRASTDQRLGTRALFG
jgi:hypothetical protein